ncbi:DUF4202 domain-containing protein [Pseudomonas sp. ABC1]|uniref:DUF4202 domain-containing protein n=1 Tax=Pseudomonas sp. ABC1 TaxID=2748080 RepID=UPI0015C3FA4A|nr:DUF4202 domain-containing protein [Pseudomonas sp. ABC1]QLF94031.1 DUF4202 domain-containing protein [Pseudomonas sp. ABC1]
MNDSTTRLQQALERYDAYNAQDPNTFEWQGEVHPRELFLSRKRHEWVLTLAPHADEALILAARSQHIGRWEMPRDSYPEGRIGYLQWRKDLMLHHAEHSARILRELGYTEPLIERVRQIIQKKGIKTDADVQVIENALCLVFLQYQYEPFHQEYPDKIVDILCKSLRKMDASGHAQALTLDYSEKGLEHIQQALAALATKPV